MTFCFFVMFMSSHHSLHHLLVLFLYHKSFLNIEVVWNAFWSWSSFEIFGAMGIYFTFGSQQIDEMFTMSLCFFNDIESGVGFSQVPQIHRMEENINDYWCFVIINKMSEENQKIQKYIIKSSPYGELN